MPVAGSVSLHTLLFVFCLAIVFNIWRQRRLRGGLPLPPGPTGLPLIGSVLDVNSAHPWLSYEKWGKKYGGLIYINMLGMDFIIISSAKVAHELMDQRSAIYSERPHIKLNEMFGMDFNSGLLPYGDKWRLHRKLFYTGFKKGTAPQYQPMAIRKAHQLIENLLNEPLGYSHHFRTYATSTIMAALYGYEVIPKNDPFVTKIDRLLGLYQGTLTPEIAALVLAFPFLAHIPAWLPGGGYKRQAAECRAAAEEVLTGPVEYVKEQMAAGTAKESFVRGMLEAGNDKVDEDTIKAVATSAFLGGAETSDSTLLVFLLAMVLNPKVQVKALEEIHRVVGRERLPEFEDRPNLPYVEAICLETFRWVPVVPDALPHMTAESDVYQGMYIPKGAIVLTSLWAMGHDEAHFDDPSAFKPERYLTPVGTLAGTANNSFGFGRRGCPGKYLADQNVWAGIVTILATMHIGKARDEFGNEIEVKAEFTSGLATAPKPFACSITPNSPYAENLIRKKNESVH